MLCACEDKMVYVVQYTDATAADRSWRYYQIWGVMMCDWTKGWGWTMCWVLLVVPDLCKLPVNYQPCEPGGACFSSFHFGKPWFHNIKCWIKGRWNWGEFSSYIFQPSNIYIFFSLKGWIYFWYLVCPKEYIIIILSQGRGFSSNFHLCKKKFA